MIQTFKKLLKRRPDQQRQENEKEKGEEDLNFLRKKKEISRGRLSHQYRQEAEEKEGC